MIMIVLLHVLVAFSSICFTGYTFVFPTKQRLIISYTLVGFTLATGFFLVVSKPAHLVSACISGLVYLGIVSLGIISARAKLARETLNHTEI